MRRLDHLGTIRMETTQLIPKAEHVWKPYPQTTILQRQRRETQTPHKESTETMSCRPKATLKYLVKHTSIRS